MLKLEDIVKRKVLPVVIGSIIFTTQINAYGKEKGYSKSIDKFKDKLKEYSQIVENKLLNLDRLMVCK